MIKDDRFKDTTLDNNAEIYQIREELTEKQKLSNMTFKEKIVYFRNYYLLKTIIIIVAIALVISFAYTILTPSPETVLYAAVINNAIDEETAATIQSEFEKHLNINPETQETRIDTSFIFGRDGNETQYTLGNEQKFVTLLYANELDIIIAPESIFSIYVNNDSLGKLSDQLPSDLCSSLADSFYYSTTSEDSNASAYGIYLDDLGLSKNTSERMLLGMVVNSKNKSNASEFVNYLYNHYQ